MNELVIKTRDFELAKRRLKEFSQKKADELEIDTVRTDGGFLGLGNHKVTGYELNNRLSTIQQHLIDLNTTNNKTIKEFGQIYSALEALDKDYIQAIMISIKATEKTSERIQVTQEQIKKIVDDQKKTLEVLKKFKQKLDGYSHLGDIDIIWSDCQKWYNEITTLSNSISSATAISKSNAQKAEDLKTVLNATEKKLNDLSKQLNQQIVKLEAIMAFTSELEKIVHLQDIDEMWDSLSNVHNSLTNINNELSSFKDTSFKQQSDIETLLFFMENLSSYEHLYDVDDIWIKSEELQKHKNHLGQIKHLDDVDSIWETTEAHSVTLKELKQQDENILELVQVNKISIDELTEYKSKLCSITHLNDVDDIWTKSEEHHLHLAELVKTSEGIQFDVSLNAKNIEELQKHKNHLGQIKHLDDVDSIWETTEAHSVRLQELKQQDENILELVQVNKISIDELTEYKSKLCSITHLNDVDDIWTKSEEHHLHLAELVKTSEGIQFDVSSNAKNIEELQKHKNHLGQIKHLDDVDSIWETTEAHSVRLKELKQQDENILELVQVNKISIDELTEYKSKLCSITHLNDVDDIWTKSEEHHLHLAELVKTSEGIQFDVSSNAKNIEELQKHKNHLGQIKHLDDVDSIWETTEAHSVTLKELKQQDENILELAQVNKTSIDELTEYKSKLCSITHLNDVDDIWTKSEEHHIRLAELIKTSEGIQSDVSSNAKNIEELQKHKNHLGQIKHLDDVDSIWETTEAHSVRLQELKQQDENTLELVQGNKISIDELREYKAKLCSITHLSDVDDIWNSSEVHSRQLSELEKQSDETKNIVQTNKENTDATIAGVVEKNDTAIQMLTKKIKYAYLLAGGSLGLAIIELIVILLKVI